MGDDADYRVRLEGRAELLEATRLRYRALLPALKGLRWKASVRRNAEVLAEVVRVQPQVESALAVAERRAKAEGWREDSEVLRCVREVRALEEQLSQALPRRVTAAPKGLTAQLEALEAQVVTAPRLILPGQRWATAVTVLTPATPELSAAGRFGQQLEGLFSRPADQGTALPFTADEVAALAAHWPRGEAALAALWQRLTRVDRAGTLVRSLERRAKRAPRGEPKPGPEVLLHAEFWRDLAISRIDALVSARVGPMTHTPEERLPLLGWLAPRDASARVALEVPGMGAERAALFHLARAVSELPSRRAAGTADWAALEEVARAADAAKGSEDWARLKEQLGLLVRVLEAGDPRVPPVYRVEPKRRVGPLPETLAGLAAVLRELAR